MHAHRTEPIGRRVGVLGGGQLGRMLVADASRLGIEVVVVDPNPRCPAAQVGATQIEGSFSDADKIKELAQKVDLITVEIEHVNCDALDAADPTPVQPAPGTLRIIQDKFIQKQHLQGAGAPLDEFVTVDSVEDIKSAAAQFDYPIVLKRRRLAYDGRGNAVVYSPDDIVPAIRNLGFDTPADILKDSLYVEKWVAYRRELAVMVARHLNGDCFCFPAVETIQVDNICHTVIAPAPVTGDVQLNAQKAAKAAIECFEGAGVFGVEMFDMGDGNVLINEIAPRPHNSGHYTIEACGISQYEAHLRCILGLPLDPKSLQLKVGAATMVNVLGRGATDADMEATLRPLRCALNVPGATTHWYGKAGCRKGRKMGHYTVVGDSAMEVRDRVKLIRDLTHRSHTAGKHGHDGAATPALSAPVEDVERTEERVGKESPAPVVGVIMGSDSDLPKMRAAAEILEQFRVPFELTIVSAHRTPDRMVEYARSARERGLKVIIAGAGGAAHLPGMVAALTPLPVIGVPIALRHLDGVDSLHSIVQMPRGVPVATIAIDNSTNAALLAIRMLGISMPHLTDSMARYQDDMRRTVEHDKLHSLSVTGWKAYEP